MKTSNIGIELIKKFEGCRLVAYKCPAGVWTIGYGHTKNVTPSQKITQEQAEKFLREDLESFEKKVSKYDSVYHFKQCQFDALVSFAYNVGSIDQLTANGTRSIEVVATKILEYTKAGGQVLAGLVKRRQAEHDLFITGLLSSDTNYPTIKQGSSGEYVRILQEKLTYKGYVVGGIDGIFGSKTKVAVYAFQRDNLLSVDGIVGPKTWAKLL